MRCREGPLGVFPVKAQGCPTSWMGLGLLQKLPLGSPGPKELGFSTVLEGVTDAPGPTQPWDNLPRPAALQVPEAAKGSGVNAAPPSLDLSHLPTSSPIRDLKGQAFFSFSSFTSKCLSCQKGPPFPLLGCLGNLQGSLWDHQLSGCSYGWPLLCPAGVSLYLCPGDLWWFPWALQGQGLKSGDCCYFIETDFC